jgi:hypothetical protein
MMACIGRNYLPLFKLMKYTIVVFDEVYMYFVSNSFNLLFFKVSFIALTQRHGHETSLQRDSLKPTTPCVVGLTPWRFYNWVPRYRRGTKWTMDSVWTFMERT